MAQSRARAASSVKEAVLSLHRNLPLMEQHWSEVREMRERLEQKEREMSETICESKSVLRMLAQEILAGAGGEDKGKGSGDEDQGGKAQGKAEDLSSIALMLLADSKITNSASGSASPQTTTHPSPPPPPPPPLLLSVSMVADVVMRESKNSLTRRLRCVEEAVKEAKTDQDRLCQEIIDGERDLKSLGEASKERSELISGCEAETALLSEKMSNLQRELEDLGSKFCEMNEALLGQSSEESRVILQSIREDVSVPNGCQSAPRPPLLQRYVAVCSELKQREKETEGLLARRVELGAEEEVARGQVCELREKLIRDRELNGALCVSEEELMREAKECERESHRLDVGVGRDLVAAMSWGVRESGGLYQPGVSTAPLVLLLFQQFCRQQVGSKPLSRDELEERGVTLDRLRRSGCCVWGRLKRVGYSASEVRSAGFSVGDLKISKQGEVKEFLEAGYSLQEMKDGGISVALLKPIGYTAAQLREVGYSAADLVQGRYEVKDIRQAGFSLQEMKDGGISELDLLPGTTVLVSAAGAGQVNGLYSFHKMRNGAGVYRKTTKYDGELVDFWIYRCRMQNNSLRWFISTTPENRDPGTDADTDFYWASVEGTATGAAVAGATAPITTGVAFPPRVRWKAIDRKYDPVPCLIISSDLKGPGG